MLVLSMTFAAFMKTAFKAYGVTNIHDDSYLTTVGGVSFFGAAFARLIYGIAFDSFGFKKCYMFVLVQELVMAVLIPYINTNKTAYFICVFIMFMCDGAHYTLFPAVASKVYG